MKEELIIQVSEDKCIWYAQISSISDINIDIDLCGHRGTGKTKEEPFWDAKVEEYRIKPESEKRRMTNRELAKIGEEAILKIKEMIEELSNDNEEEKL